jgi:predicted dehydrogenase
LEGLGMMQTIGVAVIGCGGISGTHLRNLSAMEGVTVQVVCDVDAERALQWCSGRRERG